MRDYLTLHGVPFVERNVRHDPSAKQELLERTGELLVPVLFIGERKIVGWDENALEAKVSDDRASQAVNHTIHRLGLKSLSGASIFSGRHIKPLAMMGLRSIAEMTGSLSI